MLFPSWIDFFRISIVADSIWGSGRLLVDVFEQAHQALSQLVVLAKINYQANEADQEQFFFERQESLSHQAG